MRFTKAYSPGPSTPQSFPGIMAGALPFELRTLGLNHAAVTLAEVFKSNGYVTAAFNAANPYLGDQFGYGRGFDFKTDYLELASILSEHTHDNDTSASMKMISLIDELGRFGKRVLRSEGSLSRFLERKKLVAKGQVFSLTQMERAEKMDFLFKRDIPDWIEQTNRTDPFFLWIHYMGVHYPYYSQPNWRHELGFRTFSRTEEARVHSYIWANIDVSPQKLQDAVALYDAAVRHSDDYLQHVVASLERKNVMENTILAITADHGEEFRDHGDFSHRMKLFQELVNVPMVVVGPGVAGSRNDEPFSLTRLGPSLLHLAGLEVAPGLPKPVDLHGTPRMAEPVFFQSFIGSKRMTPTSKEFAKLDTLPKLHGCLLGRWKAVFSSESVETNLFDLGIDPEERIDYAGSYPDVTRELISLLKAKDKLCESRRIWNKMRDDMTEDVPPFSSNSDDSFAHHNGSSRETGQ